MKKIFFRITGYLFWAFALYIVFLVVLFPYNSFIPLISGQIKEKTGLNVRIGSIRPGFPCSLKLSGIDFLSNTGENLYKLKSLDFSFALSSLVLLSPELTIHARTKKGSHLKGTVYDSDEKFIGIDVALISKNPEDLLQKLSDPKSFALAGNIDIAGFLKIPKKTLGENHFDVDSVHTAEFNLNLEKIGISLPKLPVKKLSSFAFDTINGALSMERGLVKVDLGKISGDVNGSLKGKITVMNPVLQSRLDIRSKFKPTEALVTRAAAFLSILNRKKSAGGVYTLDIKGTFLNPRPII